MMRNATPEELKTIALTSAIAAAGTAVATAVVGYLLERYVLNDNNPSPTFVVVPVVNYPVPELPPDLPAPEPSVAGLGAVTGDSMSKTKSVMLVAASGAAGALLLTRIM